MKNNVLDFRFFFALRAYHISLSRDIATLEAENKRMKKALDKKRIVCLYEGNTVINLELKG